MIHTEGGAFDPLARNAYFLAGAPTYLAVAYKRHEHILIAVNDMDSSSVIDLVGRMIDAGRKVLIDSGIFNLTNNHKRAHPGLSMDEALALPPEEIDGFDDLWRRYLAVVERFGAACWGYIELDQGGRDGKRRTRRKLLDLGLRPIPVYHPLNDGWDYFDELAEGFDRICFGNVVQASPETRKRLLATACERKRAYPGLWIHMLCMTPNETLNAYPVDSCDSSTWLDGLRWIQGYSERAMLKPLWCGLPKDFRYVRGSARDSETGFDKATEMLAEGSHAHQMNWRAHRRALIDAGLDPSCEGFL